MLLQNCSPLSQLLNCYCKAHVRRGLQTRICSCKKKKKHFVVRNICRYNHETVAAFVSNSKLPPIICLGSAVLHPPAPQRFSQQRKRLLCITTAACFVQLQAHLTPIFAAVKVKLSLQTTETVSAECMFAAANLCLQLQSCILQR